MLMFFRNENHGTSFSTLPQFCQFSHNLKNELNSTNNKFNALEPDELVRTVLYGDKNLIITPIRRY